MVSVTTASRYITSESRYYLRYQRRSLMFIHGLSPRNFMALAEAVPIESTYVKMPHCWKSHATAHICVCVRE